MSFIGMGGVMTEWVRMRSGDYKLTVAGERWAVAFVWKTWTQGYAYAVVGCVQHYRPSRDDAFREAFAQWSARRNR